MERKYRLTKNEQFQRVRRHGRSWANPILVLCVLPNGLAHSRFGFAISQRIGKATVRNRVKRLIREATRLRQPAIAPGWDLVFIARSRIHQADFGQVEAAVAQLLQRAGLLQRGEG